MTGVLLTASYLTKPASLAAEPTITRVTWLDTNSSGESPRKKTELMACTGKCSVLRILKAQAGIL